jgi:hypothetical protein
VDGPAVDEAEPLDLETRYYRSEPMNPTYQKKGRVVKEARHREETLTPAAGVERRACPDDRLGCVTWAAAPQRILPEPAA